MQVSHTLVYKKVPTGEFQPVGYFSGVFSKPESRLSSRHREIIALCRGIKHFEFHLIGTKFTAIVDHKSLLYLFREDYKCQLSNKLVNILCYLQNFDFEIVHQPGSSPIMASADYLSRQETVSIAKLQEQSQVDDLVDKVFSVTHFPFTSSKESKTFLEFTNDSESTDSDQTVVLRFSDMEISRAEMIDLQNQCKFCSNILRKLEIQSKTTFQKFVVVDWSKVPVFRHISRKAQFSSIFQDKVEKIRILTGTLVHKARVDEAFVSIDKLISE